MISSFSSLARIKKPAAAAAVTTNVIAIGAGTSANFGRSADFGATWTFGTISGITINNGFQICCGNVNSAPLWVVVGSNGTRLVSFNTTNGITWSSISTSISSIIPNTTTSTYCSSLAFGNGVFMASGFTGVLSDGPPVAISADGITWSNGGTPHSGSKLTNAVTFGNGYWVAVPNQSSTTNNVMASTNVSIANVGSITWSAANTIPNDPLYSVLYNGSNWFVGYYGKLFYSASNLPTSTFTSKGFTPTSDIAYTLSDNRNGTLVFGTWNPSGGGANRAYKIDFGSTSTFIATGGGGGIYTLNTTDVVNNTIALNGSYFSGNKAVISTNNGTTWTGITDINTNLTTGCYGVAFAK